MSKKKCSNCLDRSACCTRLPRLFGRYVYTCLDKDGQLHIHWKNPFHEAITVHEKYVAIGKDEQGEDILAMLPADNLVFKLRVGGWLGRKSKCLGHAIHWHLLSAWNGDLLFRSHTGQSRVGFSIFSDKADEEFLFLHRHLDYLSYDAAVACGQASYKFLEELVQFSIDTLYNNMAVEGMTPLQHAMAVRKFMLSVRTDALPYWPLTPDQVLGIAQPFPGNEAAWQRVSVNGKPPVLARDMTPVLEVQ